MPSFLLTDFPRWNMAVVGYGSNGSGYGISVRFHEMSLLCTSDEFFLTGTYDILRRISVCCYDAEKEEGLPECPCPTFGFFDDGHWREHSRKLCYVWSETVGGSTFRYAGAVQPFGEFCLSLSTLFLRVRRSCSFHRKLKEIVSKVWWVLENLALERW